MLNFKAWPAAVVDALALHLLLAVQLLPAILSPSRNTGFLKPTQIHTPPRERGERQKNGKT